MSDPCPACNHADCCMERGDVLPGYVERAFWPDGTLYVPRPEAQAKHDVMQRAREEAERIEAELASESTSEPGASSQDSEPERR